MDLKIIRKTIEEMPPSEDQDGGFIRGAVKLLAIMLAVIVFTELLFFAGAGMESLLMLYFLGVLVVSVVTPRYGFGVVAAVIASFSYTLLISEPSFDYIFGFHFFSTLLTMILTTILASSLVIMLKLHSFLIHMRAERADTLFVLGEELVDAKDTAAIADIIVSHLSKQLGCSAVLFLSDPKLAPAGGLPPACAGDACPFLTPDELANARRAFLRSSSTTLLADEEQDIYYQPLIWDTDILGVVGVNIAGKRLTQWKKELVDLICRQAAHALALQKERDWHNDSRVNAEIEKTRGNLLSSISHDFRAPLTSILGASNAILEQKEMLVEMRDSLLKDIQENAKWLSRMVENILNVSQISQESLELNKRLESAEEVIAKSVSVVRERYPDSMIHVRTPDELVMIPMDSKLISQVLVNLLLNAVNYSEKGSFVLLSLRLRGRLALFEVSDHGTGIPEDMLDNIFEIRARPETDAAPDSERGIAIGLNICRTIILAHNGIIEACNRREGGARFSFWLPLDDIQV